jgi:Fic family protein
LQEAKIYAEGTARNYLNRLAEIGVLEKKVIEGDHYYLNIELYRILAG